MIAEWTDSIIYVNLKQLNLISIILKLRKTLLNAIGSENEHKTRSFTIFYYSG